MSFRYPTLFAGDPFCGTYQPNGSGSNSQTTQYDYGVGTTTGTDLFSNDLIKEVQYPDPSSGAAGTARQDLVLTTYDLLGEVLTQSDQNQTTHSYSYDVLGRLTLDSITALAPGVDGSILALGYTYDALGLPYQQTSHSDAAGTIVANQVQDGYNGYGQLIAQYQSHSGAVNTSTTPVTQYTYSQPSGANYSRLTQMIYPNGRILFYGYSSGLNSDISRVNAFADYNDPVGHDLVDYTYLGLSTIVAQVDNYASGLPRLTYIKQSGESNGDAGDQITGLDRFGRVVDQRWLRTSGGITFTLDRFQYGYDADGNVLYKNNLVNSTFSELYHANSSASGDNANAYDNLNRITAFQRGTLSASGNNGTTLDTVSTLNSLANSSQSWNLDSLGNANSVTTDGTQQSRSFNSQNEDMTVGSNALGYDPNGNTVTDDQGRTLVYDAWNRLVAVKNGSTTIASYSYDANGNRIGQTENSATTDLYYSSAGQVIEERQAGTVTDQYVWGLMYVNDLILRDDNSTSGSLGISGSGLGRRLYIQQDANWNVTAIDGAVGAVGERFIYTPYGVPTVLSSSWTATTDAYGLAYGFQGMRYDAATGMLHADARDYSPTLERWVQSEPLRADYVDGMNLYQSMNSNPAVDTDPAGFDATTQPSWKKEGWEDYWKQWQKAHPGLTPQQLQWAEIQLAAGCVGVSSANLGVNALSDLSHAYKKRSDAEAQMKKQCCGPNSHPKLISIHFYTPKPLVPGPDGRIDMSQWDHKRGRPSGPWNHNDIHNGYNFDFGFVEDDGNILHANHYYNPIDPNTGKGKYYRDSDPTELTDTDHTLGPSKILQSTPDEWSNSGSDYGGRWYGYQDFNNEVWAVVCSGNYGAPPPTTRP